MNTPVQSSDILQGDQEPQYGSLKTLTLLTFIGCAISYIVLFYGIATWGNYEQDLVKTQEAMEKMEGSSIGKYMEGTVEMMKKSHEHRYVLSGTGLLFTTLCLLGAMRMRKLQKSGYALYVIGELAPLVVSSILIGFSFFGGIVMALTALFAILFVILYSAQRKYLIYS